MDVYRAIANFTAPQFNSQGRPIHTCLSFKKGDLFEVLESDNERSKAKVWWACRTTTDDHNIGYVPSKYLKFHEKRPGKLKESSASPTSAHHPFLKHGDQVRTPRGPSTYDAREIHGKALADLRQHAGEAPPSDIKVKDPVLSPTSPTAPNPAVAANSKIQSRDQQPSQPSSSPLMSTRSSLASSQAPTSKLSPNAIRVPFMAPLLPGSPVAPQSASPPSSRDRLAAHDRGEDACNQCTSSSSSSSTNRSDVIDLSTAFPAWNSAHQKAVAPLPGSCSHNQHNQHRLPSSKVPASQYQVSTKTNNNLSNAQHRTGSSTSPVAGSPAKRQPSQQQNPSLPPGSPELRRNREGLIEPKKLVNPCLESKERQVLHRELLQISSTTQGEMSAMLPKKSELRQVFEKRQEKQREKDKVDHKAKAKPDFEKELEEQVEKLQKQFHVGEENVFHQHNVDEEGGDGIRAHPSPRNGKDHAQTQSSTSEPEFVRIKAKLTEKAKS